MQPFTSEDFQKLIDLLAALPGWITWLGPILGVLILAATFFRLNEPKGSSRRIWRNAVIFASFLITFAGVVAIARSGQLTKTVGLLRTIVMSDSTLISGMRERLRHSESLIALLRKSMQTDDVSIGELKARLLISERERVAETQALRAGVRDARRLIGDAQAQTAALRAEARVAMKESYAAASDSARIAHIVQVTDAQTRSRLSDALTTARAAAAKAGVFRVPEPILQQMMSYLRASPSGSSSVACAPGLEAACGDLASAFERSGWQPALVARGASFFTGGGEDAVADANPDAGLIIWCRRLRESLARSLAATLEPAGFDVDVRIVPENPSEKDIGISVRFIRPAP